MKQLKNFLLLLSLLLINQSYGQNLITSSTFDTGLEDWILEDNGGWAWSEDGKADAGDGLWNDRLAIQSNSGPGAIVFKNTEPAASVLTSPVFNFSDQSTVFLRFNQYYRNFESATRLLVKNLSTGATSSFSLNTNVQRHVETSASDVLIFDISEVAANSSEVEISFLFTGHRYFWIIDDVEFYDNYPYPKSRPLRYANYLNSHDYPFEVDASDWPYATRELVIQFNPDTPEEERQAIRDTLGAVKIDSCVCDKIELWRLSDDIIVDQDGNPIPNGGTIGILERVKGSNSSSEVDGADLNYYTATELKTLGQGPPIPLTDADISHLNDAPTNAIRIAVLDTGLDYDNEILNASEYVYQKEDDLNNNEDNDLNCYPDDPIGWNFVDDNNNPDDNHGHGTHVTGILMETLRSLAPESCTFQVIPYKTHDANGISTLFDVSCATYLALEDSVSLINASWGFYGDSSIILRNAIDAALDQEVLFLTAAGNDSLSLDTLKQYPACYAAADNKLAIGSVNGFSAPQISPFTNYSPQWVAVLAPGEDVSSSVPNFVDPSLTALKSGTSMSTPVAAAAAAIAYCANPNDYANARDRLLNCSSLYAASLGTYADMGRVIKLDVICITPVENTIKNTPAFFDIYPNPVNDYLSIVPLQGMEKVQISLFSVEGKQVFNTYFDKWPEQQKQNLNLATLPAGIYFLHLRQGDSLWVSKVVK